MIVNTMNNGAEIIMHGNEDSGLTKPKYMRMA